jgi:tetratricopeptide (TPR) repeat protein
VPPDNYVSSLVITPDGGNLLVGLKDSRQRLRSLATPAEPPIEKFIFYRLPKDVSQTSEIGRADDDGKAPTTALIGLPAKLKSILDGHPAYASGAATGRLRFWSDDGRPLSNLDSVVSPEAERLAVRLIAAPQNGELLLMSLDSRDRDDFLARVDSSRLAVWSTHTRALTSPPVSMQRDVEALAYDVGSQSIMVAGIGGRIGKQSRDIQIFDGASMTLLAKIDVTDRFKTVSGLWIDGRGRMRMIDQFGDEGSWPLRVSDLVGELESRAVAWRVDRAFAKAIREADEALARNDVATAKDRLRQAATTRDDVSGPWVRLANLLYDPVKGTENHNAAAAAYDKAVEAAPFDILARFRRGRFRFFSGDYEEAETDLVAAVHLPMTYIPVGRPLPAFIPGAAQARKDSATARNNAVYEPTALLAYDQHFERHWRDSVDTLTGLISRFGGAARDFEFRAYALASLGENDEALADVAQAMEKLRGANGAYSGLDEFKGRGVDLASRGMIVCELAAAAVDWAQKTQEGITGRIPLLREGFDSCALAWNANPSDFARARGTVETGGRAGGRGRVGRPARRREGDDRGTADPTSRRGGPRQNRCVRQAILWLSRVRRRWANACGTHGGGAGETFPS